MKTAIRQFLSILCAIVATAVCQAAEFGDVVIERLPILTNTYIPYRYQSNTYRLQNNGAKPVTVTIHEQVGTTRHSSDMSYTRTRTIELAPSTSAHLSLYSPTSESTANSHYYYSGSVSCSIFINGKQQDLKDTDLYNFPVPTGSSNGQDSFLFSPTLPVMDLKALMSMENSDGLTTANSPVAQWPTHVREYMGFKVVFISSEDLVPPQVRHALEDYVRLGGLLVTIVPDGAAWPLTDTPEPKLMHSRPLGFGYCSTLRPINSENKSKLRRLIDRMDARTTPVFEFSPPMQALLSQLQSPSFPKSWHDDSHSIPKELIETPRHDFPLFAIMIIMAVFAVIIGPFNYWYLLRKKKQLLLILTTPVISIAFCVFVILFITFREGWRSHGTTFGITLLDQKEQNATTTAKTSFDAAFRPSGGFRFSQDDLLVFYAGGDLEVMDAPGQVIAPTIMQSRIPLTYTLQRTEPRREKLDVTFNGDGTATIVNGLGAQIEGLVLKDPDRHVFRLYTPLPPGGSATIKADSTFVTQPNKLVIRYIAEQLLKYKSLEQIKDGKPFDVATALTPGYYVAWLQEPLFYPLGMKPDTLKATHYIIGRF